MRRLTTSPNRDAFPVWTPDSRWIVYPSGSEVGNINLGDCRQTGRLLPSGC